MVVIQEENQDPVNGPATNEVKVSDNEVSSTSISMHGLSDAGSSADLGNKTYQPKGKITMPKTRRIVIFSSYGDESCLNAIDIIGKPRHH